MTERIFDDAPLLGRATANIVSLAPCPQGFCALLDRTIFFPRGGGQPCDEGTLDGVPVLDVYEQEGEIRHILADKPRKTEGALCEIRLENRLDHMQSHTGQHIISAAAWQLFRNPTLIARIERPACHIEFAAPMDEEQLAQLWRRANQIVAQALPVRCRYYTPAQAAAMNVRGNITPHEKIRLVEIQGFDLNACGGSHCPDTSMVGPLRWYGAKEVRGAFRLYFLAGNRAARHSLDQDLQSLALGALAQAESPQDSLRRTEDLYRRANQLEQETRRLRLLLLEATEENLLAEALARPGTPVVCRLLEDWELREAKTLCENLIRRRPMLVLLALRRQGALTVMACQRKGMDKLPVNQWLQPFWAKHGGKGGGSSVSAQGSVADTPQAQEDFAQLARRMTEALTEPETAQ